MYEKLLCYERNKTLKDMLLWANNQLVSGISITTSSHHTTVDDFPTTEHPQEFFFFLTYEAVTMPVIRCTKCNSHEQH